MVWLQVFRLIGVSESNWYFFKNLRIIVNYVKYKKCNPLIIWLILTMIECSFVDEKHLCDGPLISCVGTFNVICHITVWYKNILQFKIIHQKNIFFIDHIFRTSVPVYRHAIIGYASMGHYNNTPKSDDKQTFGH